MQLQKGMILVVMEQHGCTGAGAQAIFNRHIHHRTQRLVQQEFVADSVAKRQASSELWGPLAQSSLAIDCGSAKPSNLEVAVMSAASSQLAANNERSSESSSKWKNTPKVWADMQLTFATSQQPEQSLG